jgi:hypothetical protein
MKSCSKLLFLVSKRPFRGECENTSTLCAIFALAQGNQPSLPLLLASRADGEKATSCSRARPRPTRADEAPILARRKPEHIYSRKERNP